MSGAARKVVMSGMRPTGRLHLGNHWGALRNWVELQGRYDCYFAVVDWHMLTTGYEETARLREHVRDMVLDWLAAGLDPERCTVFLQSDVPQHAELALLLSMITPISWLENNPTYKEQLKELAKTKHAKALEAAGVAARPGAASEEPASEEDGAAGLRTHGFLGYPVLQSADIVLYGAELVPVGQDQLPHVELSREISRRFNSIYGPTLSEPQALLTPTPKVPGVDGRKMSKSYGNTLELLETPESLRAKVLSMYTDPLKVRAKDPGHPEGCAAFALHKLYSAHHARREEECRAGSIGCVACKQDLLKSLEPSFDEFRRRREELASAPGRVDDILAEGGRKARAAAERTMARVRKAMNLR